MLQFKPEDAELLNEAAVGRVLPSPRWFVQGSSGHKGELTQAHCLTGPSHQYFSPIIQMSTAETFQTFDIARSSLR